jgi:uncharacterized protein
MIKDFVKIDSKIVKNNLINLKNVVFEVTDACNLQCKYCGYGELYYGYSERKREKLSFNKAVQIINYLTSLWIDNLGSSLIQPFTLSFYGGEPLLNMHLIREIVLYVENLKNVVGKKFYYNMTTNGILLNRYMDYLAEKKFNLLVSIDGNETNHSYRVDTKGQNSHRQVVENIKLLQQTHPEYFLRHVRFNTVLHNRNSVESAFRYIKDNFGKNTKISPLNNSGIRPEKVEEFLLAYQNINESINNSVDCEALESELFIESPRISQLANFLYHYSGNVFDTYNDLLVNRNKPWVTSPTGTCTPFSKKMFVSVNGKILSCEKVNHEFAWGQVYDDKVDLDMKAIVERFNNYVFRYIRQCRSCAMNDMCKQCVFQIDDINDPDTKCRSYTNKEAQKRYIQKQLDYMGKHPNLYDKILKKVIITK